MRHLLFIAIFIASCIGATAQQVINLHTLQPAPEGTSTEPQRTIEQLDGAVRVTYTFSNVYVDSTAQGSGVYTYLIDGFGMNNTPSTPAIPVRGHTVEVPPTGNVTLSIDNVDFATFHHELAPAIPPVFEDEPDKPALPINIAPGFYPTADSIVTITEIYPYRKRRFCRILIRPIIYDHSTKTVKIAKTITFTIHTEPGHTRAKSRGITDNYINNLLLNPVSEYNSIEPAKAEDHTSDYLILSTSTFKKSIDFFASWKRRLGYRVHTVYKDKWETDATVKDSIDHYYDKCPNLEYMLIIGSATDVPPFKVNDHCTDLYYACVETGHDFSTQPTLQYGRIPATTNDEALAAFIKIKDYEMGKTYSDKFFKQSLHCAQFQDDSHTGYETRRFVLTSEEILNNARERDIDVCRVYSCTTTHHITPKYFNNSRYNNNKTTELPAELLKKDFNWAGSNEDIYNVLEEGAHYVLYRGHGGANTWVTPSYNVSDIEYEYFGSEFKPNFAFRLSDYTYKWMFPVIYSVTCQTGDYASTNKSFAKTSITHNNGGSSCIIGATDLSYSGYNDIFSLAMFESFSDKPIESTFMTDSDHAKIQKTFRIGEIMNQGLVCMNNQYNNNPIKPDKTVQYEYEIFHCFGDPSMLMRTEKPSTINADITVSDDNIVSVTLNDGPAHIAFYDYRTKKSVCYYGETASFHYPEIDSPTAHLLGSYMQSVFIYAPNKELYTSDVPILKHFRDQPKLYKVERVNIYDKLVYIQYTKIETSNAFIYLTSTATGQVVLRTPCETSSTEMQIDVSSIPSGTYVLSFVVDNSTVDSQTIKI